MKICDQLPTCSKNIKSDSNGGKKIGDAGDIINENVTGSNAQAITDHAVVHAQDKGDKSSMQAKGHALRHACNKVDKSAANFKGRKSKDIEHNQVINSASSTRRQPTEQVLHDDLKHDQTNLSKSEKIGLESLIKRVSEGEICIATSDKSKRFVVLMRDQYVNSGLKHTVVDTQIEPEEVKRFQTTLNTHSKWLTKIFNICSDWGQEDRMMKNVIEGGEQTCPMTCLIKDHKGWSYSDQTPNPPSRPVVAGNMGINRCMSEILSLIIEPITTQMGGHAIDSTSDMLNIITELNESGTIERLCNGELNENERLLIDSDNENTK